MKPSCNYNSQSYSGKQIRMKKNGWENLDWQLWNVITEI